MVSQNPPKPPIFYSEYYAISFTICNIFIYYFVFSVTLDTPMNRKFMPDADQTAWTPMEFVAEYVASLLLFFTFLFGFVKL